MVNETLVTGHQANTVHCYKFHILQQICSTQYLQYYFGTGEDDIKPGSIPGNTMLLFQRKMVNEGPGNFY
jgi:hypothetical protein